MPEWTIRFEDVTGVGIGEINPANLDFTKELKRPGHCNCDVPVEFVRRNKLEPYAADYCVYRDDAPIVAGIVTGVSPSKESEMMQVAGLDYLHYLEKRIYPFDPSAPVVYSVGGRDVLEVVGDILGTTLNEPGSLSFTYTTGVRGKTINYRIEVSDTEGIYEKIYQLSESKDGGFDFEATWDKQLLFYVPKKGTDVPFVVEEGRNAEVEQYRLGGIAGTYVKGMGSGTASRVVKVASDVQKIGKYRRLDHVYDAGDVTDPTLLQDETDRELVKASTQLIDLSIAVRPIEEENIWSLVDTGDSPRCVFSTDYEEVDDRFRVVTMQGRLSEEGDEEVVLSFDDATI